MANNPLGVSTGQGKGEAQVFGSTYNDYFKQKADEGAKKKAEIEKAMAQSTAGVWDRDLGMFKPLREDLRKYVQDNARAIIDGDFDATVGWQKKQNEMLDFVNSSKAAKDFYDKNLALLNKNPTAYSDLSKKDLFDYANTAGRFDSNIFLEGKFDSRKSLDAMNKALGSVQYYSDGGVRKMKIGDKDYAVETLEQRKEAAKDILDSQIAADKQMFFRQAEQFWTPEEYNTQLSRLENSLGKKSVFKEQSDGFTSYDRKLAGNLKKAENLKKDIWLAQNYVGEESDLVLQKLVESDKNIISARHTMSDPNLKNKYKGAGGIVISRRRGNDVVEEFVAAKDYNTLLTGMLRSGLYPSNMRDYLDQVPDYAPSEEYLKLAGQAPEAPEATQQVSDLSNLISNMPGVKLSDDYKAHITSLGLSDDLSGRLLAKVGAKKKISDVDVLEVISPDLKASNVTLPIGDRGMSKGSFGGSFESIETSNKGKTVKINFKDPNTNKVSSVELDTTLENEKNDLQTLVREILTGVGKKGKKPLPSSKSSGKKPLPKLKIN